MTSDSEARAVQAYLLSEPNNLTVGLAVFESWPAVRDHVCKRFLDHLRRCIERSMKQSIPEYAHDVEVGIRYGGDKNDYSCLWLYRRSWTQYNAEKSDTNGRSYIFLYTERREPNGWYFGVSSPSEPSKMTEVERRRRSHLDRRLKDRLGIGRRSDWNPWWAYVDDRMRNWNGLVPDLSKECNAGSGEITDYFVNVIMDIALKAIPVMNETERNGA